MISAETLCVYPFLQLLVQIDIISVTTYNTDRNTDTVSLDCFLQTTAICRNCHKLISHTLKNNRTIESTVIANVCMCVATISTP